MTAFAFVLPSAGAASDLVVGEIEIRTRDIFAAEEIDQASKPVRWLRRGMNGLHFNTRPWVIRQEVLFHEGDVFDPADLAETERNLRALGFLNEIRITAVDTTADGRVNVRIDAHETWSLNTALTYSRASDGGQRWSVLFSDRNVLGYGFTAGGGLGEDEIGAFSRFWFDKRRVAGSRWQLGAYFDQPSGGHRRGGTFARPFYAQGDRWGLEIRFWNYLADDRYFLSNASPAGLDAAAEASLYAEVPRRQNGIDAGFLIRLGSDPPSVVPAAGSERAEGPRIWRLGAGARVTETEHRVDEQPVWYLSDGRWQDLSFLQAPGGALARSEGTRVFPYLHLETMGRRWAKERYVSNHGPVEDLPLAWHLDLKFGPAGYAVGSTAGPQGDPWRTEVGALRFHRLGGGLFRIQGGAYAKFGAAGHRTHRYDLLAGWTTNRGSQTVPWLTRVHVEYGQGRNLAAHEAFVLDLVRGVRTLEFDGMAGDRLARWNVEQGKVLPWTPLGLFKSGVAVFYSGGSAWWRDEDRDLGDARHEIGCGLRFGPTRSSRAEVTRIDLTWNTSDFGSGPVLTSITRGTF